jgi:hypothetical protein
LNRFSDNLKTLGSVENLAALELRDAQGCVVAHIENKAGSQGSLAVYAHLLARFGELNSQAAQLGLVLYAEHTEDAKRYPGKHPNIDRLIQVIDSNEILSMDLIDK